jgi:mRNA interferase MazF
MAAFASAEVILLPFPFSDLSASKLRPALLLADAKRGDWVLCQITSKPYSDDSAIALSATDFEQGSLERVSFVRPSKLFTANESLFQRTVGRVSDASRARVVAAIVALLQSRSSDV